jgi:HEAT repeat protein
VKVGRALYLFSARAAWRVTGSTSAARTLVDALGSEDYDIRTIAGMFLVKAGRAAEPLLLEALEKRENVPMVLAVLADLGDRSVEPQIARFASDPDPEIARAATDALKVLRVAEGA